MNSLFRWKRLLKQKYRNMHHHSSLSFWKYRPSKQTINECHFCWSEFLNFFHPSQASRNGLMAETFCNNLNNEHSCRDNCLTKRKPLKNVSCTSGRQSDNICRSWVYRWDFQHVDDRTWGFAQRMNSIVNKHWAQYCTSKEKWLILYTHAYGVYDAYTHEHLHTLMFRHQIVKDTHLWQAFQIRLQSLPYARTEQTSNRLTMAPRKSFEVIKYVVFRIFWLINW